MRSRKKLVSTHIHKEQNVAETFSQQQQFLIFSSFFQLLLDVFSSFLFYYINHNLVDRTRIELVCALTFRVGFSESPSVRTARSENSALVGAVPAMTSAPHR